MNNQSNSLSPLESSGHPQTVGIFKNLAEGFDINVEPSHLRYWRSMLTVGRAIDTLVDTHMPLSIEKEAALLLEGTPIEGINTTEAEEFSDVYHGVSNERQAAIRQGLEINNYAIMMRQADTYEAFIKARTEEAEVFGNVMRLDNPDEYNTISSFNTWLPKFARAGYLIDSFGDFSQDYKDGVIGLQPTMHRRIKLGKQAIVETYQSMHILPPSTLSYIAVASLSKMARNGLRKKQ